VSSPVLLLPTPADGSFATGCDDRIDDLDGVFIETLAEDLGMLSRLKCSSGGPFGNALCATQSGVLFQIDPGTGDAEEIGRGGR
jgi:hypothetical protein